jgi:hypothetical protein
MQAYMLATADAEGRFIDQSNSLLDSLQEAITNLREAVNTPGQTTVVRYQRLWGEIEYLVAMAAPVAEGPTTPLNSYSDNESEVAF